MTGLDVPANRDGRFGDPTAPLNMGDHKPRLYLLVSHLEPTLGLERAILDLLRVLAERYDLHVTCASGPPGQVPVGSQVQQLGGTLVKWRRLLSIPRLRRWARQVPRDAVIIVAGAWVAIPWLLVAGPSRRRTVVWEHSMLKAKAQGSAGLRALGYLARGLYPRSAAVVCVSQSLARELNEAVSGAKVAVISNGAEQVSMQTITERVLNRFPEGGKLLAVGSLTQTKNHSLAIEAMTFLPRAFELHIAGDGPDRAALSRLIGDRGLSSRVHLLGHVDRESLGRYYASAVALVHMARAETFGYVFYEAADWVLPVVALKYGVATDVVPRLVPGRVVDAQPRAVATAVLDLDINPPGPDTFLRAAKRRRLQFDPSFIAAAWVDVIEETRIGSEPKPILSRIRKPR